MLTVVIVLGIVVIVIGALLKASGTSHADREAERSVRKGIVPRYKRSSVGDAGASTGFWAWTGTSDTGGFGGHHGGFGGHDGGSCGSGDGGSGGGGDSGGSC